MKISEITKITSETPEAVFALRNRNGAYITDVRITPSAKNPNTKVAMARLVYMFNGKMSVHHEMEIALTNIGHVCYDDLEEMRAHGVVAAERALKLADQRDAAKPVGDTLQSAFREAGITPGWVYIKETAHIEVTITLSAAKAAKLAELLKSLD